MEQRKDAKLRIDEYSKDITESKKYEEIFESIKKEKHRSTKRILTKSITESEKMLSLKAQRIQVNDSGY